MLSQFYPSGLDTFIFPRRFYFRLNYTRKRSRYFFSKRYGFLFLLWVYFIFSQHMELAFIGIHPFGGFGGPEKDQMLGALLGLFAFQFLSPLMRRASCISFGIIVTLFAWMAHKLESSRRLTKYASEASCRAIMAPLWKHMFILPKSWAISLTNRQFSDE